MSSQANLTAQKIIVTVIIALVVGALAVMFFIGLGDCAPVPEIER